MLSVLLCSPSGSNSIQVEQFIRCGGGGGTAGHQSSITGCLCARYRKPGALQLWVEQTLLLLLLSFSPSAVLGCVARDMRHRSKTIQVLRQIEWANADLMHGKWVSVHRGNEKSHPTFLRWHCKPLALVCSHRGLAITDSLYPPIKSPSAYWFSTTWSRNGSNSFPTVCVIEQHRISSRCPGLIKSVVVYFV